MSYRSILLLLLLLLPPATAFGVECSYYYSAINHPEPRTMREKLAGAIKRLPKASYKFLFANTINDYRVAWKEGSVAGRPYRIVKRILFAPRIRTHELSGKEISSFFSEAQGKNLKEIGKKLKGLTPAQRQLDAEKKIQWMMVATEPAFDGVIELTSKLKQKFGHHLGLNNLPIKGNLSMAGGIALNVATGYGTWAVLSDKLDLWKKNKLEEKAKKREAAGVIGAQYLAGWEEAGFVDVEQSAKILGWNSQMVNNWGANLSSTDPKRPLPPRFYQFRMEGLLKDDRDVSRFEDLALAALQEAQAEGSGTSDEVKAKLLAKLKADPLFGLKTEAERNILALAFEPPVFLDENDDHSWYDALLKGDPAPYLASKRDESDIHWMLQVAKNPALKAVRDLFPDAPAAPLTAIYANLSAGMGADREAAAAQKPWFPKNQLTSMDRADYFENLYPPASFVNAKGEPVTLSNELDYLEAWQDHPFFNTEMEAWKSGDHGIPAKQLVEMRQKTNALDLVAKLQAGAVEEGRPDVGRFPPDPNAAEACFLTQKDAYLKGYTEKLIAGVDPKQKNFCRYLVTVNFWRMSDMAQKSRSSHEFSGAEFAKEMPHLEQEYLKQCADPAFQTKFAAGAKISFPELEQALDCTAKPGAP